MKAKDLRIGNYVYIDLSIDDIEVVKLKIGDLASFAIGVRDLFPIPLTEEWLFKFGFHKGQLKKWHGNGYDYQPKNSWTERIVFTYSEDIKYYFEKWTYDNGFTFENQDKFVFWSDELVKCEYVHQLQNLYFALTGEELEIKKKV